LKYKKLDIKGILDYLSENQPITLAFHWDADGVYSAALLSSVFKVSDVVSPDEFGDYVYYTPEEEDENQDIIYVNLGLDLGTPLDKNFHNVLIDHHPHPTENELWYNLIWDRKPTTGIVYDLLKDKIPEESKWKVVGGLLGDGQVASTPDEVWDNYHFLVERRTSIYKSRYNKMSEYNYPVFKLLSSPVNAMCRMGSAVEAYEIVLRAKTPYDILENKAMKSDQDLMNSDENEIWSNKGLRAMQINRDIAIVEIESKYKQAGRIAAKLRSMNSNITWIIVNPITKHVSIRGELAKYVSNKLSDNGIVSGGHPGYCAATLSEGDNTKKILEILRKNVTW